MMKLLVILGSTATGKTDLGLMLAGKFNGELVSADSRQIYKGLDIGTGKYLSQKSKVKKQKYCWEVDGIRIWMYDMADPRRQYTVADYVKDADRIISDIAKRGKLPILVGGTGLYLKALLGGLPNLEIPIDKKLRKKLEKLSLNKLQEKLQELSRGRWQSLNESDKQNPRRLIRHIELTTMYGYMNTRKQHIGLARKFNVLKIGLSASREILYKRADERVLARIKQGMIDEAKILSLKRMRDLGLEYGVIADYLEGLPVGRQGKIKKENLTSVLQGKIHGYIRRQLTWFKKDLPAGRQERNVEWFDITTKEFPGNVEKLANAWYYHTDDSKN